MIVNPSEGVYIIENGVRFTACRAGERQSGQEMDQMMGSLGHGTDADMTCGANAMVAELNRHKGVACSSTTDMGPNKSEAQQHVATMTEWANHQMVRSHDMGSMMGRGMGGMGGGGGMTTGHCVENSDGSFSME